MAESDNHIDAWQYIARILTILQIISIIAGLTFIGVQLKNIAYNQRLDQALREIEFLREFKKELTDGINNQIYVTIVKGGPILKQNGGKFSDEELKEYISLFNQLGFVAGKQFIDGRTIYSFFYFYIAHTYEDKEIQAYLKILRVDSPDRYSGLDSLYKYITDYHSSFQSKTEN